MSQQQKERATTQHPEQATAPVEPAPQPHAHALSGDVDELLAEIDSVLEENAEAWVAAFKQKGGQ